MMGRSFDPGGTGSVSRCLEGQNFLAAAWKLGEIANEKLGKLHN